MRKKPKPVKIKGSDFYYFYYYEGNKRVRKSTGETRKYKAEEYITQFLNRKNSSDLTFREYAEPYFQWDSCPHIRRLLDEKKNVSKRYAENQRALLEKYLFTDKIADKKLNEITRADIIDFRSRLNIHLPEKYNTINKVIEAIKVIFKEAIYREDIQKDPTAGIGNIKYEKKESGIFTKEELAFLFGEVPGVWKDIYDYTCFLVAASMGMRRGEIVALKWKHINLDEKYIQIVEAWKGKREFGSPKWDKKRICPVPYLTLSALLVLQEESIRISPDDYIFSDDAGNPHKDTWWRKRFLRAMKNTGIDLKDRSLKPHSFRHSLNTHLLNAGCDPVKIQAFLGWSPNIKTPILTRVQEGYTHIKPDHLRELLPEIEKIFQAG